MQHGGGSICLKQPPGLVTALASQVLERGVEKLSGGQRFNVALTEALAQSPDLLLLDEPTNHLDRSNRGSLMRMLQKFSETLIVVSHDTELLRTCVDRLWHIREES